MFFDFNCIVLEVCPMRIEDYTLSDRARRSSQQFFP